MSDIEKLITDALTASKDVFLQVSEERLLRQAEADLNQVEALHALRTVIRPVIEGAERELERANMRTYTQTCCLGFGMALQKLTVWASAPRIAQSELVYPCFVYCIEVCTSNGHDFKITLGNFSNSRSARSISARREDVVVEIHDALDVLMRISASQSE